MPRFALLPNLNFKELSILSQLPPLPPTLQHIAIWLGTSDAAPFGTVDQFIFLEFLPSCTYHNDILVFPICLVDFFFFFLAALYLSMSCKALPSALLCLLDALRQ